MTYTSEQTAFSQMWAYTQTTELLYLLNVFKSWSAKNMPARTTISSVRLYVDKFIDEVRRRYMHSTDMVNAKILDVEVIDVLMCNQLVDLQVKVMDKFISIIMIYLHENVRNNRVYLPSMYKHLDCQVHDMVRESVISLDMYRGMLYGGLFMESHVTLTFIQQVPGMSPIEYGKGRPPLLKEFIFTTVTKIIDSASTSQPIEERYAAVIRWVVMACVNPMFRIDLGDELLDKINAVECIMNGIVRPEYAHNIVTAVEFTDREDILRWQEASGIEHVLELTKNAVAYGMELPFVKISGILLAFKGKQYVSEEYLKLLYKDFISTRQSLVDRGIPLFRTIFDTSETGPLVYLWESLHSMFCKSSSKDASSVACKLAQINTSVK